MLSSNQVLNQGRYRIIDQFGTFDSGRLYEAYDTASDTKVVLSETVGQLGKVATAAQIENFKAAFAADAKRLAEVEHPSLLKVKDFFSEIDRQYLVMESCEGSDLATFISTQEKRPSTGDILRWADQMLDGLYYLHTQNPAIIHQAISPQTARLTSNFTVKLLVAGGNHENSESDESGQAYKALEQLWIGLDSASQKMIANNFGEKSEEILRQPLDARTDVYSVGSTLYFLLTGEEPADALARYLEILDGNDDPLQDPGAINSSIPSEIAEALKKAMELKRENRFESAAVMRAELAKVKVQNRLADVRTNTLPATEPVPQNNRLEKERLRVEKERMELEAEQKRLEEEQARVEKRKLELEAEKARQAQLLEANRLEEERQKAEKAEAERAAAEKAKAQTVNTPKESIAVQSNAQKSAMDPAKDDLLDLPDSDIEKSVEPDVLALEVERPNVDRSKNIDTTFDIYPNDSGGGSFFTRPPMLIAAAAVVLVGIIGVWMFAGSGKSPAAPAATVQTAPAIENSPTQSVDLPPADSNSSFASQPDQQAANSTAPGAETKAEQDAKSKAHKQPTPQAKPTVEKKKVTVDDLINDN